MFAFFDAIGTFITTVVDFIVNLVTMLVMVVLNIGRSIAWLFLCIASLPPWLTAFVIVPISLAVVFQILNKGS